MKKVLRKSNLVAGILILIVVCLGIVFAGDVIVKNGDLDVVNLNVSGDLTTSGTGAGTFNKTLVSDGSASVPSYSFTSDTDTGMWTYEDGGGHQRLAFSIDGLETFEISQNSFLIKDSLSNYFLEIRHYGTALTQRRTLTIDMNNGSRTLDLTGNATLNQDVSTLGSPTFAGLTVDSTNNTITTSTTYDTVGIGRAATNWGKLYVYGDYGSLTIDQTTTYPVFRARGTTGGGGALDVLDDGSGNAYIMNSLDDKGLKLGTRADYHSSVAIDIKPDRRVLMPYVYSDTVGGTNRDLYIDYTGKLGYVSSSRDIKDNIRDATNTDWIYNLRVVDFDYKDASLGVNQTGLIAEEVELIEPRIVSYKIDETLVDTGRIELDPITREPVPVYEVERIQTDVPETVNYGHPILISTILKEMSNLKQENQMLKDEIARLKEAVGIE